MIDSSETKRAPTQVNWEVMTEVTINFPTSVVKISSLINL